MTRTSADLRVAAALVALAALAAAERASASDATQRLGDAVRPKEQTLALRLDPAQDAYTGTTTIELEVARETPSIRLHARELKLAQVGLIDAAGARRELAATAGAEDIVALGDGQPIAPGAYRLTIDFAAAYNRNAVALYKTEIQGAPYLFTQFEAVDARGAFPSFDEPAFKIPFEIELEIPAGFDALANSAIESEKPAPGGGRTVRFKRTRPLPSYLVAFAVGTFDFVPIPGLSIPGRIVTPKGMGAQAAAAVETTPPILAALERWFGAPYPYDKLDLLAIPEYWFGAMENPGAITYAAEILLPGATPSPADRRRLIQITAHELAHIWFGDMVTMAWWDDLWLNETFADWMGDKIAEQVDPTLGIAAAEMGSVERQMSSDARPSARAVRPLDVVTPESAFQAVGVAYNKGKAVLSMVERWIGEERFRAGVLDHLARHAWGNATSTDLWQAFGRATPLPAEAVLRSFVEQPGLPLVVAEPIGAARVRLSQRRYATAGVIVADERWQIPIRLRAGDGTRNAEASVVLGAEPTEIAFDGLERIDWLLPNAGAAGYFRWHLPENAMTRLIAVAPQALTPLERRQLLGNAAALLASGDLDAGGYLALLAGLGADPDPGVAGGVLQALQSSKAPLGGDGRAPGWSAFVRRALLPALERIGREPHAGESAEVAALRPRLLDRLGNEGDDPETLAWATKESDAVLAGSSKVDDDLAEVALELAARAEKSGARARYDRYRARALAPKAPPAERSRFLGALTSFRDRKLAEETLALYPEGKLRGDEFFVVYGLADIDPTMPDRLLDWTIELYPKIASDLPAEFRAFMVSIAGGCDRARFERSAAFFGAPERAVPGSDRRIAQTRDQVEACAALREREGERAASFLAASAAGGKNAQNEQHATSGVN